MYPTDDRYSRLYRHCALERNHHVCRHLILHLTLLANHLLHVDGIFAHGGRVRLLELAARTTLAHTGPGTGQDGLGGNGQIVEKGILVMRAGEGAKGDESREEFESARPLR